ncbi:MAG: DUF1501 domain-containing protein, partial [Planctomycetales bacterium]|nr:DUF1501 domain-containing protein [Planctomycetales bacterium]
MAPLDVHGVRRRDLLRLLGVSGLAWSGWGRPCVSWTPALAAGLSQSSRRKRCVILWMNGGPSQTDTFDMKPDHANGGEFKEVATNVPGVRFSEHLPKLGKLADRMAIVRSLSTKEGDHARGAHLVRTGRPPMGAVANPSLPCAIGRELASNSSLPDYVSVAPRQEVAPAAFGPGFLGAKYAPALVSGSTTSEGVAELRLEHLEPLGDLSAVQQ